MNAFKVHPEVEALEERRVFSTAPPAYLAYLATGVTHSLEYYVRHETMDYSYYLHRGADAGVTGWAQAVRAGLLTMEQADAHLTASAEYVSKHGGAYNPTWVQNVYYDLLHRPASAAEANAWSNAVQAGVFPPVVAAAYIAGSAEREAQVVTSLYTGLLFRSPSTAEVNAWVRGYQVGLRTETIQASFIASAEYAGRFSSSPAWLTQLYLDALNRQPGASEFAGWLGPYNVGYNPTVWAVKAINEPTLAASYDDINQRASNTCYILAPLSAAASKGMNLAGSDRIQYVGNNYFQVRLYDDVGHAWFWQTTVYNGIPVATDPGPSPEGDYWPILYQHAYLDRWVGGDPMPYGYADLAMIRLTGTTNYVQKYVTDSNDFWTLYNHPGQPAVARGNVTDAARGVIGAHFYTIIGVGIDAAHGSTWYVTLRNPYGQDTPNDWINSFYSYWPYTQYHDGINDLFSDGLIRVTWATFTAYFNYYVVSWYTG